MLEAQTFNMGIRIEGFGAYEVEGLFRWLKHSSRRAPDLKLHEIILLYWELQYLLIEKILRVIPPYSNSYDNE